MVFKLRWHLPVPETVEEPAIEPITETETSAQSIDGNPTSKHVLYRNILLFFLNQVQIFITFLLNLIANYLIFEIMVMFNIRDLFRLLNRLVLKGILYIVEFSVMLHVTVLRMIYRVTGTTGRFVTKDVHRAFWSKGNVAYERTCPQDPRTELNSRNEFTPGLLVLLDVSETKKGQSQSKWRYLETRGLSAPEHGTEIMPTERDSIKPPMPGRFRVKPNPDKPITVPVSVLDIASDSEQKEGPEVLDDKRWFKHLKRWNKYDTNNDNLTTPEEKAKLLDSIVYTEKSPEGESFDSKKEPKHRRLSGMFKRPT